MKIYPASQRGTTELDWLLSRHSFSFGDYYNPQQPNFGVLRVLNDDWIAPDSGFLPHPHENMEIITIMLTGTLQHEDSMGNKGTLTAGEVQQMSAGTGIEHAEYNLSKKEKLHLLQLWIAPQEKNITPRYEQRAFIFPANMLVTLVSGNTQDYKNNNNNNNNNNNPLLMQQKGAIMRGRFEQSNQLAFQPQQGVYLFVISGKVNIHDNILHAGDACSSLERIELKALEKSDILLIDVPQNVRHSMQKKGHKKAF